MSYGRLLLIFLVAPTVLLAVCHLRRAAAGTGFRRTCREGWPVLAVLVLVSTCYTAPWDKWMIDRGVFVYPPPKVAMWISGIPVEDLLLFALQCLLVGLWSLLLTGRMASGAGPPVRGARLARPVAAAAVIAAMVISLAARSPHALFLASILIWFGPLLAVQYAAGADILLRLWRRWLAVVVPPTLWLWLTETVAIRQGVWWIDPAHSVAFRPGGLPSEDLVIFLVGNLFVAQTILLVADPVARARTRAWYAPVVSSLTRRTQDGPVAAVCLETRGDAV
jgi:lycopene beta-cyclase